MHCARFNNTKIHKKFPQMLRDNGLVGRPIYPYWSMCRAQFRMKRNKAGGRNIGVASMMKWNLSPGRRNGGYVSFMS